VVGPMAHSRARRNPADGRSPVRRAASTVAVVFLVIGVLGFVPGITSSFADLRFAGHQSGAKLFGAFQVSVLHNAVHLLFGVAGLALARTVSGARTFLVGGGAIYLVLWLYGLVVDQQTGANVIPVNNADNWLHLLLGIGMIALGLLTTRLRAHH
jgi:4-hydroxybenzoate polyprenyltransferase